MKDEKYEKEWAFVKKTLKESGQDDFGGGKQSRYPFRSRFEHTRRVYKWVHRLLDDATIEDVEVLELAAIFHDVGYSKGINKGHGLESAKIFEEYARKNLKLSDERIEKVKYLVSNHSNKEMLLPKTCPELIILMEADVMDEEGAMRIAWDCLAAGLGGAKSFQEALKRTIDHFNPEFNPMITPIAIRAFEEKQNFVKEYIKRMKDDLEV